MDQESIYIGNRYVPKMEGEWNQLKEYEGLSIVTLNGSSYTSKKRVPEGVAISNEEYWVKTGDTNGELIEFKEEVTAQLAQKASIQRAENIAQQVNELVVASGDPETSQAELIQARPDSFGSVFPLLKTRLDNTENIINTGERTISANWEQGSILQDGSTDNQNSAYIRMVTLIPKPDNGVIFVNKPSDYRFSVAYYDDNQVFVERTAWLPLSQSVQVDYPYYKVSFGADAGTMEPSDSSNTRIFTYFKENHTTESLAALLKNVSNNKIDITMQDFVHGGLTQDGGSNTSSAFLHNVKIRALPIGSVLNIECTSGYTARVHYYDENKQPISNTAFTGGSFNVTLTHPYFRVLITHPTIRPLALGNVIIYEVTRFNKSNDEFFNGETILNLGDSIAHGAYNNYKGYSHLIAEKYGLPLFSHSQGGATFANNQPDRSFIKQQFNDFVTANPTITPDYILMNGLTNDILYSTVGTITDGYDNTFDESTYCGGFESVIHLIKTTFPDAKLIFVKVHNMSSRDSTPQKQYQELASEITKKWAVPVVDLYNEGNLNTQLVNMKERYTDTGTHPNLLGYNLFYVPQITAKMKELK